MTTKQNPHTTRRRQLADEMQAQLSEPWLPPTPVWPGVVVAVLVAILFAVNVALLSGCTPITRAQTALALADTSGAIGCIAEAAGKSWGAPLCRAAEWLADFARRRVDKLTTRSEEKAAAELEAAVEACDPEPTVEQLAAVELAQASCDGVRP